MIERVGSALRHNIYKTLKNGRMEESLFESWGVQK